MDFIGVVVPVAACLLVLYVLYTSMTGAKPVKVTEAPPPKAKPEIRDMTLEELATCDGKDGRELCVGCSGDVFNMLSHESGRDLYGPGGPYHNFAARDSSVGLATMEVDPAKWTKKVDDLTASERDILGDWHQKLLMKYEVVARIVEQ